MVEKLRVGVIGLRRGLSFVRLLGAMDGVEVVAVADVDQERLEHVCREHAIPRGCTSLTEILDADLDLLVIATLAPQHVEHAVQTLERGVHVLSEVPAITRIEDCDALIAAVERSGRQYMLAENCCYWAFIDMVKQLHQKGQFGTIFYAEAEYIHNIPELRRDAHGVTTRRATLAPITYITHSLGPITWVTGQSAVETTCYGTTGHLERNVPDVQVAIFRMSDGSVARITCSFANAHWEHHCFAFFGTQASLDTGSVGIDEPKFWSSHLPNVTAPVRLPVGRNFPRAPREAAVGGHGTAEWFIVRDFLRAVRDGARPPIDVYDAIAYSLPRLCARDSAVSGRAVEIPAYQRRCQV